MVKLKKHFLTLPEDDLNNTFKDSKIYTINHLLIWIKNEEDQNVINEILEYTVDKLNSFEVISEAINKDIDANKDFIYLNNFSEKLKKEFAENIKSINLINYLNENILKLAFEQDNDILNEKLVEYIPIAVNTISSFHSFLIKITDLIVLNKESKLSISIKNEIEKLKSSYHLRNNSVVSKSIKENLSKLSI